MWVYIKSEPGVYAVGFFSPDGNWHPEPGGDFSQPQQARERVSYLNGGSGWQGNRR